MRTFWGWVLFLIAWFDAGIIWYNTAIAPWKYTVRADWVLWLYVAFFCLCLFGWYKLIRRPKREVKDDD